MRRLRPFWQRMGFRARGPRPARPPAERDPRDGRNGMAMLLSVVIALFLSLFFRLNGEYTVDVDVPLTVYSLPESQALREPPPASVRVTFEGDGWSLFPIVWDPPPVGLYADSPTVDVLESVREAGLPTGVSIQSASPRTVELVLDERVARLLPIRLVKRLAMESSYDLLRPPLLSPDSVMVSGARSVLDGMRDWPTVELERAGVRDSFRQVVALSDTLSNLAVSISPQATLVSVPVEAFTRGERMVNVVVRNLPSGVAAVRTEPSRIRATYTVPAQQRVDERARTTDAFMAVLDYADIARDPTAGSARVSVQTPIGLDIRDPRLDVQRVEYFIVYDTARDSTAAE